MTLLTEKGERKRMALLLLLTGVTALMHFMLPTEPLYYHEMHIVLRKLFYLPPLIAAAWFGVRGAISFAFLVSAIFCVHSALNWPGSLMEQATLIGELASFWVVGLVPAWLLERQRLLLGEVANANEETLLSLVSALDLREHSTRMHSQRVREYTQLLTGTFDLPEKEVRDIGFGALLHDVGKIAVPDHVLLKREGLSGEEWAVMRRHPEVGYGIVKRITFLREAAELVYAHHECWDGSGYPRGLRGDAIPLGARLFMVADVYDAVTSDRPYHSAVTHREASRLIREKSGSHFDPAAVEAFLNVGEKEFEAVRQRYRDEVA
ncbi:HD domain-containing protein [Geomonas sp. RF6]|uniref:HD-GYP domain-containing protein n=1 Tax=Geomonas sp. RF6 TaxID=2897342 RepID=UPI001E6300F5|nr:HD domain-containing phosphohydrolase [Geomonas sp. RF6]UFS71123.1 HD domain-containing protein [Geomonas sp. RF6]